MCVRALVEEVGGALVYLLGNPIHLSIWLFGLIDWAAFYTSILLLSGALHGPGRRGRERGPAGLAAAAVDGRAAGSHIGRGGGARVRFSDTCFPLCLLDPESPTA